MILLFNPTNEQMNMVFGGRGVEIAPEGRVEVEDACGKHLLNSYGVRGLCSLRYGDDEKAVGGDGVRRNLEFKKRLVSQHNYRNVVRKQQGLIYSPPSKELRAYAEEMGIPLDEPYAAREKEHDRLAVLENTVSNLSSMMQMFMAQNMKEEAGPVKAPRPQKEKDK